MTIQNDYINKLEQHILFLYHWVDHFSSCEIDMTDFCTCGLRELKRNISESRRDYNQAMLDKK